MVYLCIINREIRLHDTVSASEIESFAFNKITKLHYSASPILVAVPKFTE